MYNVVPNRSVSIGISLRFVFPCSNSQVAFAPSNCLRFAMQLCPDDGTLLIDNQNRTGYSTIAIAVVAPAILRARIIVDKLPVIWSTTDASSPVAHRTHWQRR